VCQQTISSFSVLTLVVGLCSLIVPEMTYHLSGGTLNPTFLLILAECHNRLV